MKWTISKGYAQILRADFGNSRGEEGYKANPFRGGGGGGYGYFLELHIVEKDDNGQVPVRLPHKSQQKPLIRGESLCSRFVAKDSNLTSLLIVKQAFSQKLKVGHPRGTLYDTFKVFKRLGEF